MPKSFFYYLRNLRYKKIFTVLCKYSKGNVLDVGGWDFYLNVLKKNVPFDHWTVIESDPSHLAKTDNDKISIEQMDAILEQFGEVTKIPINHKVYNRLKGISNYKRKQEYKDVKEFLWLLQKK